LIGRHDIGLQKNSAVATSVLFDEIYGLPYDETFHYAEKIHKVTADDILRLAQNIFTQREVVSLVGPRPLSSLR